MNKTQFVALKARINAAREEELAARAAAANAEDGVPIMGDKPSWLDKKLGSAAESITYNLPTLVGMEKVFAERRAKRFGISLESYLIMQASKED